MKKASEKTTSSQQGKQKNHVLDTEEEKENGDIYPLFAVGRASRKSPYIVAVKLNGLKL